MRSRSQNLLFIFCIIASILALGSVLAQDALEIGTTKNAKIDPGADQMFTFSSDSAANLQVKVAGPKNALAVVMSKDQSPTRDAFDMPCIYSNNDGFYCFLGGCYGSANWYILVSNLQNASLVTTQTAISVLVQQQNGGNPDLSSNLSGTATNTTMFHIKTGSDPSSLSIITVKNKGGKSFVMSAKSGGGCPSPQSEISSFLPSSSDASTRRMILPPDGLDYWILLASSDGSAWQY